ARGLRAAGFPLDTHRGGPMMRICHVDEARRATRGPREARPAHPAGRVPSPGLAPGRSDSWHPPGGSRRGFSFGAVLQGDKRLSVRVGVFGATGYAGQELVRLLRRHPRASVAFTTGSGAGHLPHEKGLEQAADVYMLALPHGVAATYARKLR